MSKKKSKPSPAFLRTIRITVGYWKQRTNKLNSNDMIALDKERQNLFQAVRFGLQVDDVWPDTAEIAWQLRYFISQLGYWPDWTPLFEQFIEACEASHYHLKFKLMISYGDHQRHIGQLQEAVSLHKSAITLAAQLNEPKLLAEAHCTTSETFTSLRNFEKARVHGTEALTLFRNLSHESAWIAASLHVLGLVAWNEQNYDEAITFLQEALILRRGLDNKLSLARVLNALANVYMANQQFREARQCFDEGITVLESTSFDRDKIFIQIDLGILFFEQSNWEAAESTFRQAYELMSRRPADIRSKALTANNLGLANYELGALDESEFYLQEAIELWQEYLEEPILLANLLVNLSKTLAGQGKRKDTRKRIEEAKTLLAPYKADKLAQNILEDAYKVELSLSK